MHLRQCLACAILNCTYWALPLQEKSDVEPELPPALASARGQLVGLAGELARLQAAAGLPIAEEEYLREVLHPGLMQVR